MTQKRRTKAETQMTPKELRKVIRRLRPTSTMTDRLAREQGLATKGSDAWKRQWVRWLGEYDGPGYYNRKNWNRSAKFVFNHFHNAPGLMWLAEAVGVPAFALEKAKRAVLAAEPNVASEAAALRDVVPWSLVETLIKARS